jgi:mRNA interferase MazF
MKNKIILVPFPFDDLSSSKVRPALCLTDSIGAYDHVVISFITSQIAGASEPSDLRIITTDPDFELTGLKLDSVIRLHRLVTIPTRLIQRQLGVLPDSYQSVLEQKLRTLFNL